VSIKDANGMVHKWFRATELLPASATPANPQHPGLVPGAMPTVPVQAGLPGVPGSPVPGLVPGGTGGTGGAGVVNPANPNTPPTDPAAVAAGAVPNPLAAAAGAAAAGADGKVKAAAVDENGEPVVDENGDPVDENGDPVEDGEDADPADEADAEDAEGEAGATLTPEQQAAAAALGLAVPDAKAAKTDSTDSTDDSATDEKATPDKAALALLAKKAAKAKTAKAAGPGAKAAVPGAVPVVPGAVPAVPPTGLDSLQLPDELKKAIAAALAATANPQKGMNMKFQLSNDKGQPIVVTEEQLEAAGVKIVKEGETVIAKTDLIELQGQVTSLSERLDQTEKDKTATEMSIELNRLSSGAFITRPERAWAEKTWKDATDLSGFMEWAATKTTPVVSLNKEHGSSGKPEPTQKSNGEQATEKLISLSRQISKEQGISLRDATIQAGAQLATEAESYREQFAEP
jgi:hypothetical protein